MATLRPPNGSRYQRPSTPSPDAELDQEGMNEQGQHDYLRALAAPTPIWKSKGFLLGAGALAVLAAGCFYYYSVKTAEMQKIVQHREATNVLLAQATAINKAGVETLKDAEQKGIKLECSLADAELLVNVIVDPHQKGDNGLPLYGGNAVGVAQQAGLLLGIMAEKNKSIESMIFKNLEEHGLKMNPDLFSWTLQRLAVANVKNINNKLKTLSKKIVAQPKSAKKSEILAQIWEVIGLRVMEKDLPEIIALMESKEMSRELAKTLAICIDNIVMMMDDGPDKIALGDKLFEVVPSKYRELLMGTMASACSPKALAYYKKRLKDTKYWATEMSFMAMWGNDDQIPYLIDLHEKHKDTARVGNYPKLALMTTFTSSRERDEATVALLLGILYDKLDEDTSAWDDVLNKTDPDAAAFVGKDAPDYAGLMEQRKALAASRQQKLGLMAKVATMKEMEWVLKLIEKFEKDADPDVVTSAEKAREAVKSNVINEAKLKANYKARTK